MVWIVFSFGIIAIFIAIIIYRTISIKRLPTHLRWELTPIPGGKSEKSYGGSYFEDYERWKKRHGCKYLAASVSYMAKEIFLMRGVWKNNRTLWPMSLAFHLGIYLILTALFISLLNAIFMIADVRQNILNITMETVSMLSLSGFILGGLGAFSLILKRALDSNLRNFTATSNYFNLVFLCAIFVSGIFAWLFSDDFAYSVSLFIKELITLDTEIALDMPMSLYIVLSLLFILYLPFTNMIHFIAKYFLYHDVRWNDQPQDSSMEKELRKLQCQPVSWAASHIKDNVKKDWVHIVRENKE